MDDHIELDPLLQEGNLEEYVETTIFEETIDTLELHVDRKDAVADTLRYGILWLLYEYREVPRKVIAKATGKENNGLQHHLRKMLNNNLITEVSGPTEEDGRTSYYRITKLGEQEIEADILHITGEEANNFHAFLPRDQQIEGIDSSGTAEDPVEIAGPVPAGFDERTEEYSEL